MSIFFLCAVRKIHKIDDLSLYSLCSLHNIRYRIFAGFLPVFHRKFDPLTFAFPFFSNIFCFFNFRRQKSLPISLFPPIFPSFRIFPRFQVAFQAFSARFRRHAPPEAAAPAHAFAPLCLSTGRFSRQEREPARKDCWPRTGPLPLPVWHVAFHAK